MATSYFVLLFIATISGQELSCPNFGTFPDLNDIISYFNNSHLLVKPTATKGLITVRIYGKNVNDFKEFRIQELSSMMLNSTYFDTNKKTIILYPGFHQTVDTLFPLNCLEGLTKNGTFNIFVMDYTHFSSKGYLTAVFGLFFSAHLCISQLVIVNGTYPVSNIHCVGHSLGAHGCGLIGKHFIVVKMDRISALDPAGPGFDFTYNIKLLNWAHLTRTDASFVDVIHTDRGFNGISHASGTADFYVNCNGYRFQAGCPFYPFPLGFSDAALCSHARSALCFCESVTNLSAFQAVPCESYELYEKGMCNNNSKTIMGMNADRSARGSYFLHTTSTPPFGLGPQGATSN